MKSCTRPIKVLSEISVKVNNSLSTRDKELFDKKWLTSPQKDFLWQSVLKTSAKRDTASPWAICFMSLAYAQLSTTAPNILGEVWMPLLHLLPLLRETEWNKLLLHKKL